MLVKSPLRAGASTIIEIYKVAGLVQETDGKVIAAEMENLSSVYSQEVEPGNDQPQPVTGQKARINTCDKPVVINININTSVDELDSLSEKIRSLLDSLKQ